MRALVLLNVAAFAIVHTMATLTTAAQEERASVSPIGAILALDTVVQKRFEHVNRGFGLDRISTAHGFKSETDAERSSVRELDEAHLTVGLYLAGRAFLEGRRHGGPLLIGSKVRWPSQRIGSFHRRQRSNRC